MTTRSARLTLGALFAALTLLLAGCSGATPTIGSAPAGGSTEGAPAAGPAAAPAAPAAPADTKAAGADQSLERKVAKTAQLAVTVANPADAAKGVRAAAERLGGYVTNEDVVTEQRQGLYTRPSTVVISVPSAKLDEALDAVGAVGTVTYRAIAATDVTAQVVDVDARIKTLRDSIARVEQLMAKAGSVTEIASVERELTSRQSELESLLGQQKSLANRVEMTPITVSLRPDATLADPNPLLQGLTAGWDALLASLRIIVTLVGALLPFALLGGAAWLGWRAWRRRQPGRPRQTRRPRSEAHTPAPPAGDD